MLEISVQKVASGQTGTVLLIRMEREDESRNPCEKAHYQTESRIFCNSDSANERKKKPIVSMLLVYANHFNENLVFCKSVR